MGSCFPKGGCMEKNATLRKHHLCAALRPYCLVRGYKRHWPDITIPFRFSLDTQGPLCLEFKIIAAKTTNGGPKIGLVDAEDAAVAMHASCGQWPGDLTHGHAGSGPFAIAFDPACGRLSATALTVQSQSTASEAEPMQLTGTKCDREYYIAKLNWDSLGDSTENWNFPIHAALVLEHGKLTFFRMWGAHWHSSGIICDKLPRRVLPCIFMSSFVGYTEVSFVRMWSSSPDICLGCDVSGHGLANAWRRVVK